MNRRAAPYPRWRVTEVNCLLTATCLSVVGLAVAGCSGAERHAASTTTSRRACCSAVKTDNQIAAARSSNQLFELFPDHTASVRCEIPHGGPIPPPGRKATLPGTCSTHVGSTQRSEATVVFTEHWMVECSARNVSGTCKTARRHTWEIRISSTGKVLSVTSHGAVAPQHWV